MSTGLIVAFAVLMGSMILSRIILNNGLKKLEAEKKAELIDAFSKERLYQFGFIIVLTVGYFFLLKYQIASVPVLFVSYVCLFAAYFLVTTYMNYTKLKKRGFEQRFIVTFILGTSVRIGGVMVILLLLMGDILSRS